MHLIQTAIIEGKLSLSRFNRLGYVKAQQDTEIKGDRCEYVTQLYLIINLLKANAMFALPMNPTAQWSGCNTQANSVFLRSGATSACFDLSRLEITCIFCAAEKCFTLSVAAS